MACKSLILGILFSIGVFAVKSGVGLHYFLSRTPSKRNKAGGLSLYSAAYLLLFLAAQKVLSGMDIIRHMGTVQAFIESGMVIHLIMAGLLSLWGLHLLRHQHNGDQVSRGWLMLAVPCPVCATVIFLSLGFLNACFPDSGLVAALALYTVFLTINGLTVLVMAAGSRKKETPPEIILGSAMLLISIYFLLSVTVMPQFADADKIYRMSLASSDAPAQQVQHLLLFVFFVTATFISGFSYTFIKNRRNS